MINHLSFSNNITPDGVVVVCLLYGTFVDIFRYCLGFLCPQLGVRARGFGWIEMPTLLFIYIVNVSRRMPRCLVIDGDKLSVWKHVFIIAHTSSFQTQHSVFRWTRSCEAASWPPARLWLHQCLLHWRIYVLQPRPLIMWPILHYKGYKQKKTYIAAQGPLTETVADFWRMVWKHNCSCIVMLCQKNGLAHPLCLFDSDSFCVSVCIVH